MSSRTYWKILSMSWGDLNQNKDLYSCFFSHFFTLRGLRSFLARPHCMHVAQNSPEVSEDETLGKGGTFLTPVELREDRGVLLAIPATVGGLDLSGEGV
jgi:hypothetical protein